MPPISSELCARLAVFLAGDGAVAERCVSLLPDHVYVTVVEGPHSVVVLNGDEPVTERGFEAGVAFLDRVRGTAELAKQPVALLDALSWLEALPPGFTPAHFTDAEDRTGATRFRAEPFRLELRRPLQASPAPGADVGGLLGGARLGGSLPQPSQQRAVLEVGADGWRWALERRSGGSAWQPEGAWPDAG